MHTFAFEKLEVWQLARKFAVYIYHVTSGFPREERFGLVSQLRRAAISIASNIAEGSARRSSKDQAKFYQLAYGSALEVVNQAILSLDLSFLPEGEYFECRRKIEEISNKLNSLRKAIYPGKPNN